MNQGVEISTAILSAKNANAVKVSIAGLYDHYTNVKNGFPSQFTLKAASYDTLEKATKLKGPAMFYKGIKIVRHSV